MVRLRIMIASIFCTDEQLTEVIRLAASLRVDLRAVFLEQLAREHGALGELGDGVVFRTARKLQRELFDLPNLNDAE